MTSIIVLPRGRRQSYPTCMTGFLHRRRLGISSFFQIISDGIEVGECRQNRIAEWKAQAEMQPRANMSRAPHREDTSREGPTNQFSSNIIYALFQNVSERSMLSACDGRKRYLLRQKSGIGNGDAVAANVFYMSCRPF